MRVGAKPTDVHMPTSCWVPQGRVGQGIGLGKYDGKDIIGHDMVMVMVEGAVGVARQGRVVAG